MTAWTRQAECSIMQERWLTAEEIAEHLGVNPDTICEWIDRKKVPGHKADCLWKFQASEVDQCVVSGLAAAPNLPAAPRGVASQPKSSKARPQQKHAFT